MNSVSGNSENVSENNKGANNLSDQSIFSSLNDINIRKLLLGGVIYLAAINLISGSINIERGFTRFSIIWTAIFLLYLYCMITVFRMSDKSGAFFWVAAIAIVLRLPMLPHLPLLSDDIYRYVWDGLVTSHGINPFAFSPDSAHVAHLVTDWHLLINFPEVPTVYPPAAQALFWLTYEISPTITASKVLWTAFDCGNIFLIAVILKQNNMPRAYSVVYALCPLAIVESSHSGHLDYSAVFFLLLAIYLYNKNRDISGHLAITASILIKFFPLVLLPAIFLRTRKRWWMLLIPAIITLSYLPLLSAGNNLWFSIANYGANWKFNAFLFQIIDSAAGNPLTARVISGTLYVAFIGFITAKRHSLEATALLAGAGWLMLTTTVHPWYLVWILPFICIHKSYGLQYWLWAVGLSYYAKFLQLNTGWWAESRLVWYIEYMPLAVLFACDIFLAYKSGNRKTDNSLSR